VSALEWLKLGGAVGVILGTCWLTAAWLLHLAGVAWPPALMFAAFVVLVLALS